MFPDALDKDNEEKDPNKRSMNREKNISMKSFKQIVWIKKIRAKQ